MRVVAIGGSDAGISAALRAREVDPEGRVRVLKLLIPNEPWASPLTQTLSRVGERDK